MKQLQEMNVRSLSDNIMINEAWGVRSGTYTRELKAMLDRWEDKKRRRAEKEEKAKNAKTPTQRTRLQYSLPTPSEAFMKYPVSILVDKLGYEIEMKKGWGPNAKERPDSRKSARFIEQQLNDGKVTPEELAKWWEEYDTEINKKQYFDPEWIVKQLDPAKLFNPYDPDNTGYIDTMIENPAKIIEYMGWRYSSPLVNKKTGYSILSSLSNDEVAEVLTFYTEPTNQEMLHKLFKKSRNRFLKAKPSLSDGVTKWISELFDDDSVEYDGCDLKKALEDESKPRTYYQGSNDRSCEGRAVVGLVYQAIEDYYKLGISNYNHTPKTEDEDALRKFIKDCNSGLHIEIHKGKQSKVESGPVASSSFWTDYGYDMDVKIKVYNGKSSRNNDEEYDTVFEKTYKNIVIFQTYYSGGWN